jgi:hypothetical protein
MKYLSIPSFITLALLNLSDAATLAQWTFEGDVTTPSIGSGSAVQLGTSVTFNTGNGGGRGWSVTGFPTQGNSSGTDGVRFDTSTVGYPAPSYAGIQIVFDLNTSNTSSRWFRLDHTSNGGTDWTLGAATRLGTAANVGDTWHSENTVFLSDPAILNNPAFGFRIVSVFSADAFTEAGSGNSYLADSAYEVARNTTHVYTGTGLWRFDNVTVHAIPETSSTLLGGLGVLALLRRRR